MATKRLADTDSTPIEVFARTSGLLHWLCPKCHYISRTRFDWRRPIVKCSGVWRGLQMCQKRWRLGLGFRNITKDGGTHLFPPFNAWAFPPTGSLISNRLLRQAVGDEVPAIAYCQGRVEFRCPTCDAWNSEFPDFTGQVTCQTCTDIWAVCILFHPPTARTHRLPCPRDWSVTPEKV